MNKLYPPYIEGTIPAFHGTTLIVPYTMNRTVSKSEVSGFKIIIKSVSSNKIIKQIITNDYDIDSILQAYFTIPENTLLKGLFYKVQIAYISTSNVVGYFSTVGVVKYIAAPEVTILNMSDLLNNHKHTYIGQFSHLNDVTEKAYSYHFDVYDNDGTLYLTSEELIHNSFNDINDYFSTDAYSFNLNLETNKPYYILYFVTTINKAIFSSPKYRIVLLSSIDPEILAELKAESNFEDGFVKLSLIGAKNEDGIELATTGTFVLSRSSNTNNYNIWDEIFRFSLHGLQPSRELWQDFTVEQGISYLYSLLQYNDTGLYSNRILSNEVLVDFEDAFLYDGEHLLKIKYNPKISSFKTDILENKIDTIGGKYPFILKNGNVNYKEFSISGLISYLMDEGKFFINDEEFVNIEKTTNLTGENLKTERLFKLKVLDWLNNGKAKLFRSPGEGNYIVRLMLISLTPEDLLGRMLHSFSATAYEIAEYNYNNLIQYEFAKVNIPSVIQTRWETVLLTNAISNGEYSHPLNTHSPIKSASFVGMIPGDTILVIYKKSDRTDLVVDIVIGSTGAYLLESLDNEIAYIKLKNNASKSGTVTYSYESTVLNKFDTIIGIEYEDVLSYQLLGEHNILEELNDVRTELTSLYYIHFEKRPIENIYLIDGMYYQDLNKTKIATFDDPFCLYLVKRFDNASNKFIDYEYYDYPKRTSYSLDLYSTLIQVDDNNIDIDKTYDYEIRYPLMPTSLRQSIGVISEVSYQKRILTYKVENNSLLYNDLYLAKQNWLSKKEILHTAILGRNVVGMDNGSFVDLNTQEYTLTQKIRLIDSMKELFNNNLAYLSDKFDQLLQEAENSSDNFLQRTIDTYCDGIRYAETDMKDSYLIYLQYLELAIQSEKEG